MFMGEYFAAALEDEPSSWVGRNCDEYLFDCAVAREEYFCLLYGSASSIGMSPSMSPL